MAKTFRNSFLAALLVVSVPEVAFADSTGAHPLVVNGDSYTTLDVRQHKKPPSPRGYIIDYETICVGDPDTVSQYGSRIICGHLEFVNSGIVCNVAPCPSGELQFRATHELYGDAMGYVPLR